MSNLSTLPKGDSAWLLRKSIQRIIQQVSVLETNIGSSTTGNSANTQVIFNDDGVLRGDADFTFNPALNKLSVNNIEVATTATITGNLTVDTNTLFVDSANNRVGIGTASPAYPFQVNGRISYNAGIGEAADLTLSSSGTVLQLGAGSAWTETRHYVAGAEAMRLNSTGLGVGVSPSAKLHIQGAAAQAIFSVGSATDARHEYYRNSVLEGLIGWDANTMRVGAFQAGGKLELWSGGSTKATLDSSGNVGVGVSTFGTSAARVLSIATGTEPTTGPTGTVQWFTSTRSANNTIPAIFTEGSGVTNAAITNVTVTNKIALKVNGTIYYLLATTSAS